jgi:hypothetical protein
VKPYVVPGEEALRKMEGLLQAAGECAAARCGCCWVTELVDCSPTTVHVVAATRPFSQ